MLKNISILAISTSLTMSSVIAMDNKNQDNKDKAFSFSYAKMFGQEPKTNKLSEKDNQINVNNENIDSPEINCKKFYDKDVIDVKHLTDDEIIKIAYIVTNFVVKHNEIGFNKVFNYVGENLDKIANEIDTEESQVMAQLFIGLKNKNSQGIGWEKIKSKYSKREITLDYCWGYRIKFSMDPNKIYVEGFNTDNAQSYPLLQIIVRNLEGDKDELVGQANAMWKSFSTSGIESKTSQEYSEEDAKVFFELEQKVYKNKTN